MFLYAVPLPVGNVKAEVELVSFAKGPLTKLDALPPETVAEVPSVSRFDQVELIFPFVRVRIPLTVVLPLSVTPSALLIVRLLTVLGNDNPVTCATIPLKVIVELLPREVVPVLVIAEFHPPANPILNSPSFCKFPGPVPSEITRFGRLI